MKLKKLYRRAIEIGMEADPRGKAALKKELAQQQERMKKLSKEERELFDEERTWNPFADSRILHGTGEEEIKRVMIGIDIETAELILADRLREKGEKIDCVIAHHPEGRALADLEKVMPLQVDLLAQVGVPVNHSEAQLRPRMERIWRSIHSDNLFRTERAAELLDIPMLNFHTVSDNLVWRFMEKEICKKSYDNLGDVLKALLKQPEYAYYAKKGNPPILVNGSEKSRPGKIVATEFTGGTNGPEEFLEEQSRAGVGTILSMHVNEKTLEEAKKHNVNMIQCSHMASDVMGLNLLMDILAKEAKLDLLPVSGFLRVKRR